MIKMNEFFPFNLKIKDKLLIIVGGGKIALHKLKVLLPYEPKIKIIAEKIKCVEIHNLAKKYSTISVEEKQVELNDLEQAFLVVLATDNKVLNKKISKYLDKKNILVNNVNFNGNIIFPAIYKNDELMISVSTSGISPSFASQIRNKIAKIIGNEYIHSLKTIKKYRDKVKMIIKDKNKRVQFLRKLTEILLQENYRDKQEINYEVNNLLREYKLI